MAFCTKCGTRLEENQKFCCLCGNPVKYNVAFAETPVQQESAVEPEGAPQADLPQDAPEGVSQAEQAQEVAEQEVVQAEIVSTPAQSMYREVEPEYPAKESFDGQPSFTQAQAPSEYMTVQGAKSQRKKCVWMSIVCFVISIVGLVASMSNPVFVVYNAALLLCTAGLIFGIISFKKGRLLGFSIAGVIINSLSILICASVILMTVFA